MKKNKDLSKQALDYHQTGDLANAEALYLKILKGDPQNLDIIFLLGTLYLQSENPDAATTFLKKAITLKPDHVEAHNNLGTVLQNQDKLDEAVESYNRAINLAPDYAEAFYNLGSIFNKQRKFDKAIEHYKQAISLRPDDYEAHLNIGNTFKELGKLEEAEKSYRRATALKPDYAIAHSRLGVILQERGKFDESIKSLKRAITLDPTNADIHNNLGTVLTKLGKLEEAVESYNRAIKLKPGEYRVYSNLASALKESGKLEEALISCNKAIDLNPNYAEAHNNLGAILQETNQFEKAIVSYKKAIELKPDNPEFYSNLGSALKELDRFDEAAEYCQRAIVLKPDYAEAYNNLGTVLQEESKLDEAIVNYKQAIKHNPDHARAHSNLGIALHEQGKTEEALRYCRHAVSLNPYHAYLHNNLGAILQELNEFDEAMASHNRAIELKPNYAEAYSNLGAIFKKQGKAEDALTYYRKSLALKPDNAEVHKNIGVILEEFGNTTEALSSYQKSLCLKYGPGVEIKTVLLHPTINESQESIRQYRENLIQQIESLNTKGLRVEDPSSEVGSTNFFLAYHGLDDREIQEKIASFHMNVCPDLVWTSPYLNKKCTHSHEKINLGIISHYLTNHTIGHLNHGIIKHLSRERFHVTLFRFIDENENSISKAIDCDADEVIVLPRKLKLARQKIAENSLNILFYLEIGMDPLTYFLAFSRLAPVQCVTWGHPVTTGIPNIDYFISSEKAELPDAQNNYSEKLVLPSNLTTYYYRPQLPDELKPREYFGLSKEYNLYMCPQSLFKFHPDFDSVLGELLRQDELGLLVLIEGMHEHWTKLLHDRFINTFPDVIDRVKFLPRMPKNDYMSLLLLADVLLDTPYFGGGNTSMEAFACKIPLVTWPGEYLCSRLTLALYRQMDIMDCVASDAQAYLKIAYRLANDATWRSEIIEKIEANADCLFENIETVHELERFFEMAVEKVHNGNSAVTTQSVGTGYY